MNDSLNFNLKGNQYNLRFPNVGGYKQIQVNKQLLSRSTYKGLVQTTTNASQYAADIVDIESTMMVIAPEQFFKDLKSKTISEMGLLDFNELRLAYIEQVVPWWNEIEKVLSLSLNDESN